MRFTRRGQVAAQTALALAKASTESALLRYPSRKIVAVRDETRMVEVPRLGGHVTMRLAGFYVAQLECGHEQRERPRSKTAKPFGLYEGAHVRCVACGPMRVR